MSQRPTGDPDVVENTDAHRYEIRSGSGLAGIAAYTVSEEDPDGIVLTHTEVHPEYEGRHLGSRLVRAVLDDARARGLTVIPTCPFVVGWIRRHPDYVPLVDGRHRATVAPPP